MPDITTTSPLPGTDERGRLIPASPEELRARAERLAEAIREIEPEPGNPEEDLAILRAIDESRASRGQRTLYEGYY